MVVNQFDNNVLRHVGMSLYVLSLCNKRDSNRVWILDGDKDAYYYSNHDRS